MQIENEIPHYRARFDVYPYASTSSAFPQVTQAVWKWVRKKESYRHTTLGSLLSQKAGKDAFFKGEFTFPDGYHGGMNTAKRTMLATDSFDPADGSNSLWALEYDEPDGRLSYRHWHTYIGISYDGTDAQGPCRVNVRISLYTLPDYIGRTAAPPHANVPNFVKDIIRLDDYQSCVGETVVLPEEKYLNGSNFQEVFRDNLLSPDRELPLILMVTDKDGATPVWDATSLAENIMGMANVYVADYRDADLCEQLFTLFKRDTASINYRCNPGMLRVYRPGIDLSDPYGYRIHRFFLKREVDGYYDQARRDLGESASEDHIKDRGNRLFADVLSRSLARGITKTKDDVINIADVERARSHWSMSTMRSKYDDLSKRMLEAERDKSATSSEDNRQELREWQQLANDYMAAYEKEEADNSSLKDANSSLEGQVSTLRYRVESAESRSSVLTEEVQRLKDETIAINNLGHLPTNLLEELRLAQKLWPSRICVLHEAFESAERFPGNDLDEQWQILSATANTLWSLYFTEGSADIPSDFKDRTGYDLSLTEKRLTNRNDAMMRQRERLYRGKTIDVTSHIKGKDKNPRFAFRLYYYADEEEKVIVIGHCGGHLTTSGTQKLK